MTIPRVANVEAHTFTSLSEKILTLGFTPTVGNILVLCFAHQNAWSTTTIVSDGASWVQVTNQVTVDTQATTYHSGVLTAAPATITVNFAPVNTGVVIVAEIENATGLDATSPVKTIGNSNSASAGPFTPTATDTLSIAFFTRADGDVNDFLTALLPVDYSFQLQANGVSGVTSTQQTASLATAILTAATAQTVTATLDATDRWTGQIFALTVVAATAPETRTDVEERSWTALERGLVTANPDLPNHLRAGIDRLIVYFRNQPKLVAILESWLTSMQDLEEVFWDIHQIRDIDTATGVNLDTLGRIVGQLRGTLSDARYRIWLKARLLANRSRGTIDEMLEILTLVEPDATVSVVESFPASYVISIFGISTLEPLDDIMSDVKPAGVAGVLWYSLAPVSGLFEFADNAIVVDADKGFSDDEITDPGGALIEIVEL